MFYVYNTLCLIGGPFFAPLPFQEQFLKHVTLEVEKRQSVKMRVKAQWASEDKMRDVLKLKEFLSFQLRPAMKTQ